jgi:hypothetical protein
VAIPFPDRSPELTEATVGILEIHLICGEFVTSASRPVVPEVASAMNWPVWPDAETDWALGTMVTAVNSSVVPPSTVKLAVPVKVLPPELRRAVIVTVPCPTAVANPVAAPIVAICWLLELQVAELVTSIVDPEEVVPIAMNWAVCVGTATDCEPGMTVNDTKVVPGGMVPPPGEPVTVRVAVAEVTPVNPLMVAVIVVVPADTPVATPEELMLAIPGTLEVQVTEFVMSCEVGGWFFP